MIMLFNEKFYVFSFHWLNFNYIRNYFYQTKKLKMLKVAILDDYQNVSQEFVDLKKLSGKYEFKIFQ